MAKNKFKGIGTIQIFTGEDKNGRDKFNPHSSKENGTTEWLKFMLKVGGGNGQFMQSMSWKPSKSLQLKYPIKTFLTNSKGICDVAWADRMDENIVESVQYSNSYTTDIMGEAMKFIHESDFIKYLAENLPNFDVKNRVKVVGEYVANPYNGRFMYNFVPRHITLAKEEEKNCLNLYAELFYNKEDIDRAKEDDENTTYISSYLSQYDSKEKAVRYAPLMTMLSYKGDVEDEASMKKYKFIKNKLDLKTKNMVKCSWVIKVFSGAEEVEFDESLLTADQKEGIELGVYTLEEFKPSNGVFGENKVEYRLIKPNPKINKGECTDTELSRKSFMELVMDAGEAKKTTTTNKTESIDDMEEDDFDDIL